MTAVACNNTQTYSGNELVRETSVPDRLSVHPYNDSSDISYDTLVKPTQTHLWQSDFILISIEII